MKFSVNPGGWSGSGLENTVIPRGLYQFWIKRVCLGMVGAHGRAPHTESPRDCGF